MPQSERKVITFNPNPLQKGFIESQADADLFSSRVGEGKSTALCWSNYYHVKHNPGAEWAFIRDTWENIQKTTLKTFFEWFPPGVFGEWNATKKEFRWAEGIASGTTTFVGMDNPADASKLLSWVLGGIAIDEPAPAAGSAGVDEMVFDLGLTRLRQPGMKWRPMKLATNNPDEEHWTYKKFVLEGEEKNFRLWQPSKPENLANLPQDYYEKMRKQLGHRPDLIRRFIDGEFGFQQEGAPVTPQWNDRIHLSMGLSGVRGRPLYLGWDFGHNPTCIIAQITPMGYLNILYSFVGNGIGVEELIVNEVAPVLREKFKGSGLSHIGDPTGKTGDQSSTLRSAVKTIKQLLGGTWRDGPVRLEQRLEPTRQVLSRTINGTGLVQVDRQNAVHVWHALRGGWHYHKARTGVLGMEPMKDQYSHPGDAFSYLCAVLYPVGKFMPGVKVNAPVVGDYFDDNTTYQPRIIQPGDPEFRIGPRVSRLPQDGEDPLDSFGRMGSGGYWR